MFGGLVSKSVGWLAIARKTLAEIEAIAVGDAYVVKEAKE